VKARANTRRDEIRRVIAQRAAKKPIRIANGEATLTRAEAAMAAATKKAARTKRRDVNERCCPHPRLTREVLKGISFVSLDVVAEELSADYTDCAEEEKNQITTRHKKHKNGLN